MKSVTIKPGHLSGCVVVPPSKSNSLRALLFASLSDQPSRIENLLASPDTECMQRALHHIKEGLPIDCGNSGLTFRFITALAALQSRPITITGDHSLQALRPSHALIEGLQQLGCRVISNGFAPITVHGPLRGGHALLSGRDSQPISALLIACSLADGPTTLTVEPMGEKPWIALTLSWLKRAGIDITQTGNRFHLPGNARPQPLNITIGGDWSSAAFPLAAGLLSGPIELTGLDHSDGQGDRALLDVLARMNADITLTPTGLIARHSQLQGTDIDADDIIDAVPILAVLCCFAQTPSRIYNAHQARLKECDRLHTMTTELAKMGARITEADDGLTIHPAQLHGAALDSHCDHRVAMALTIAALHAKGESTLTGSSWAAKTYPDFFSVVRRLTNL